MRRGLKGNQGPSYAAAHLSRRTFPDEEGTESIGFMLRPLRGRKRRRTFPDEEGTESIDEHSGRT